MRERALFVLLGAWLGVSACTWAGAGAAFVTASRLQEPAWESPGPGARWREDMSRTPDAPALARYQAAVFNRWMFRASGRVQLVLAGLALLVAAWPPRQPARTVICLVLAGLVVAVLATLVVPRAAELGRDLAFIPRPLPAAHAAAGAAMERLHALYGILDVAKAALLLLAAGFLPTSLPRAAYATERR
jgi:hypothetical protein